MCNESQKDDDRLHAVASDDKDIRVDLIPRQTSPIAGDEVTNESAIRQIPQATPPSPPYSSETSQQPVQLHVTSPHVEDVSVFVTSHPQQETTRPITPPPEAENTEHVSNGMQAQSSPRTPERTPQRRSEKIDGIITLGVVGSLRNGNAGTEMNGHMTPDAAINGASVARGTLFPRTPEHRSQILSGPLTTSRKSRPRPRPPSRKQSVQNMDLDLDGAASEIGDGPDPSPAKSDRSYFSSPASGSSSDSEHSRRSMLFVPGSPTSPLSRFAPLAHSTQVNSRGAPGSPSPLHSGRKRQNQSRSQKGIFDSQFDVDARVDQLSNFMREDVDLDAWVRATDTEGEADGEDEDDDSHDDFAVEEMTKSFPLSLGTS